MRNGAPGKGARPCFGLDCGEYFANTNGMDVKTFLKSIQWFSLSIALTCVCQKTAWAQYTSEQKQTNPFLYEVEKDGKVSYILGSMHAGIPLNTYPNEVFELSKKAKTVAFESDSKEFHKKYEKQLKEASVYPEGETLNQHLSPQAIDKLKTLFTEKGYEEVKKYKPWAIDSAFVASMKKVLNEKDQSNLWDFDNGIDNTLLRNAKAAKKPIYFLDNLEDKAKEFEEGTTAKDLEHILSYPDPIGFYIRCAEIVKGIYLSGHEQMFPQYNQSCSTEGSVRTIERRTLSWVPKLEPLLKQGDSFITVGANHMDGPNGLENLLTQKGYNVKRIGQTNRYQQYLGWPGSQTMGPQSTQAAE